MPIILVVATGFIFTRQTNNYEKERKPVGEKISAVEEIPDPCGLAVVECPNEKVRSVSAYTSEIGQTDEEPCISASGDNICELWQEGINVCAANFVPFGTRIVVDGLGECTVLDRMNSRYQENVDWYFGYLTDKAILFGRKELNVTILRKDL